MLKYKPQTKFSIATFVIIILALTLCLSSLAKTEVYFSLYDDLETVIVENINKAEVFIDIAICIPLLIKKSLRL